MMMTMMTTMVMMVVVAAVTMVMSHFWGQKGEEEFELTIGSIFKS